MPYSPSHRVLPIPLRLVPVMETSHSGPTKAVYNSTVRVLLPISLFVGITAWFVQFFIPCSAPRLHILVALISQILLPNVCALLLIYILIHYLGSGEIVTGWRNRIAQLQVITVVLNMSASFILLTLAIVAGYVEGASEATSIIGVVLSAVMIIATISMGFTMAVTTFISQKATQVKSRGPLASPSFHPRASDLTKYQWRPLLVLSVIEIVLFVALLVLGIHQAYSNPKYSDCFSADSLFESGSAQPQTVTVAGSFPTVTVLSTSVIDPAIEQLSQISSSVSRQPTSVAGANYVTITRTSTKTINVSTLPAQGMPDMSM